jgi:cytochrome c oxidase subunit 3
MSKKPKQYFRGSLHARRNPYPLLLALAIVGSSLIFLFLIFMLVVRQATVGQLQLTLPPAFWVSTLLIGISSLTLSQSQRLFRTEQFRPHYNWLFVTVILGVGFVLAQGIGMYQLFAAGLTVRNNLAFAYLFILAGLHFMHIAVGLFFIFWNLADAKEAKNYVEGYIQSLDPAKRTRLNMAVWFWHFLDVLWLILFLVLVLCLTD